MVASRSSDQKANHRYVSYKVVPPIGDVNVGEHFIPISLVRYKPHSWTQTWVIVLTCSPTERNSELGQHLEKRPFWWIRHDQLVSAGFFQPLRSRPGTFPGISSLDGTKKDLPHPPCPPGIDPVDGTASQGVQWCLLSDAYWVHLWFPCPSY